MNLNKSIEYFNPLQIKQSCHIIGLGAIGSNVAEQLTRLGITNITLYDFDTVTAHNIANQNFSDNQIGQTKLEATIQNITNINPNVQIRPRPKGWIPETPLNGYVFLCVDNIDLRRQIVEENLLNDKIIAIFDFRMRLEDAQHYAFDWTIQKHRENAIKHMSFSHEEAKEATPVSACGTTLSVIPTVKTIVSLGIANFINLIRTQELKSVILLDAFNFTIDTI